MLLTETWLRKEEINLVGSMKPPGYRFRSFPRRFRKGGGIGILVRSSCLRTITNIKELKCKTFEAVELKMKIASKQITIICVYRPPRSKKNNTRCRRRISNTTK